MLFLIANITLRRYFACPCTCSSAEQKAGGAGVPTYPVCRGQRNICMVEPSQSTDLSSAGMEEAREEVAPIVHASTFQGKTLPSFSDIPMSPPGTERQTLSPSWVLPTLLQWEKETGALVLQILVHWSHFWLVVFSLQVCSPAVPLGGPKLHR